MMRVITGSARGRRLDTLAGNDVTRPTTECVKEALFSMIQFEIEDKKILDLFAGSGQLGIEALSRGARYCVFVESNRNAKEVLQNNISKCGFDNNSQIVFSDALSYLSRKENFDVVLLDPPYKQGYIEKCMKSLENSLSEDGIVVCETSKEEVLPQSFGTLKMDRERFYGKTKLTLYRKEMD